MKTGIVANGRLLNLSPVVSLAGCSACFYVIPVEGNTSQFTKQIGCFLDSCGGKMWVLANKNLQDPLLIVQVGCTKICLNYVSASQEGIKNAWNVFPKLVCKQVLLKQWAPGAEP